MDEMMGISRLKPVRMLRGRWEYLDQIPAERRRASQASGLYGVRACWLLRARTSLCAVRRLGASGAKMAVVVSSAGAACRSLEVDTYGSAVAKREGLVDALSGRGVEAVPCLKGIAFDDLVGVAAEIYGAGRVAFGACA